MKLRKYQEEAVEAVVKAWEKVRRVLIVLPTGCGKTVVFASVIKRLLCDGRVMVLAHREELVNQARDKIEQIVGVRAQIEMGEMRITDFFGKSCEVVVSSVQTQLNRKEKFDPSKFAAVIVDEAHHAVAKSYREVLGHYLENENCRVLGVTATPDRADEAALGSVFDCVAYEYTVSQAIEDGWLVPIRQQLVKVESLDFSGVSTSAGDLNSAELAEVMEDERNLHGIVAPTLEICRGKRTILFATSVRHADRIAEIINRSGKMKATWICGATPKEERRRTLAAFKEGKVDILCNVGVLTEGFDDAGVEVVVMARPTKSRALYAQMAGRATRPAAEIAAKLGEINSDVSEATLTLRCGGLETRSCGAVARATTIGVESDAASLRRQMIAASSKPSCLIVDFVGNSGRHKLVSTLDILGGKEPDDEEIRTKARAKIEANGEMDAAEAMAEARKEIAARKAAEAKRREFIQATAKYVIIEVDPMNIYDLPPVEAQPGDCSRRLTVKQELLLRTRLRVDPVKLGYARSKQLLNEFFRRCEYHLATLPQARLLKRYGIDVPLRHDEAARIIERKMRERR